MKHNQTLVKNAKTIAEEHLIYLQEKINQLKNGEYNNSLWAGWTARPKYLIDPNIDIDDLVKGEIKYAQEQIEKTKQSIELWKLKMI